MCVYVCVLNRLKALLTTAQCEVEINITLNDNFTSPITSRAPQIQPFLPCLLSCFTNYEHIGPGTEWGSVASPPKVTDSLRLYASCFPSHPTPIHTYCVADVGIVGGGVGAKGSVPFLAGTSGMCSMNNVSLGDGLDDSLEVQGSTYGQCGSFLDDWGTQWPSSQLVCPIKQNVLIDVSITEPPEWSLPS